MPPVALSLILFRLTTFLASVELWGGCQQGSAKRSYSIVVTETGIVGETFRVFRHISFYANRNVGIVIFCTERKQQTRSIQSSCFASNTCYAVELTWKLKNCLSASQMLLVYFYMKDQLCHWLLLEMKKIINHLGRVFFSFFFLHLKSSKRKELRKGYKGIKLVIMHTQWLSIFQQPDQKRKKDTQCIIIKQGDIHRKLGRMYGVTICSHGHELLCSVNLNW